MPVTPADYITAIAAALDYADCGVTLAAEGGRDAE